LQARNSTSITGFNARFLNLIHHFNTPVKVTSKIWNFMIDLSSNAVCTTAHIAAECYFTLVFTPIHLLKNLHVFCKGSRQVK